MKKVYLNSLQKSSNGSRGAEGTIPPPGPVKISHKQEGIPVGRVPSRGGVSQHALRQTSPSVNKMTDRQV